jgi:hypothetical protein
MATGWAASIDVQFPERPPHEPSAINITLKGFIEKEDGGVFISKLTAAKKAIFKKEYPDEPDYSYQFSGPDPSLQIRLELDSKDGGDLTGALKIAEAVRRVKWTQELGPGIGEVKV